MQYGAYICWQSLFCSTEIACFTVREIVQVLLSNFAWGYEGEREKIENNEI